jgi:hypothetical protein
MCVMWQVSSGESISIPTEDQSQTLGGAFVSNLAVSLGDGRYRNADHEWGFDEDTDLSGLVSFTLSCIL